MSIRSRQSSDDIQTHPGRLTQQLHMCSSGWMRLTLLSAVWSAGCTSWLSSSVEASSLSPACLSSASSRWLAPDHGEANGWGSSCWTSLGTSILLSIPLEKKRRSEYGKRGYWITSASRANRKLKTENVFILNLLKKSVFCNHIDSQCKHISKTLYKHTDWAYSL